MELQRLESRRKNGEATARLRQLAVGPCMESRILLQIVTIVQNHSAFI